ncbi:MAG: glycosyltransferase family 4 protein [Lachnospiraceae bacterium]|nr:glycosyltransferase family 4 protein [Lachnospiraceae bacterium]
MVYYVAFYNPKEEAGCRVPNYAGEDKIDYICETINSFGENVTILSNTKSLDRRYQGRKNYVVSDQKRVVMFSSLPNIHPMVHAVDVIWGYIQLSLYLLMNVKREDTVIVYHSLGYRKLFNKLTEIKRFRYILEVEELFQYIDSANSYKKKEHEVFLKPDAYIFSNAILEDNINVSKKPAVVINGIYKNEKRVSVRKDVGHIRVLYAGNLDPQKGVDYVIRAANYLNRDFGIKIIGFGSKKDMERVGRLIGMINETSECKVSYDGVYKGEDYLRYVQSCDIGVCIQDPDDIFNSYEFPSKIFSYMSNGLKVVVNQLEQVEKSRVAKNLIIAEGTEPQAIAKAIAKACDAQIQSDTILDELDKSFKKELRQLIRGE